MIVHEHGVVGVEIIVNKNHIFGGVTDAAGDELLTIEAKNASRIRQD